MRYDFVEKNKKWDLLKIFSKHQPNSKGLADQLFKKCDS